MLTAAQKARIQAVAQEWVGTPYRRSQRVRGREGGVDCAQLLIGVFADAGIIEAFDPDWYPPDWHLHVADERYLMHILRFAVEATPPWEPGDVLLFRGWKWPSAGHAAIYLGEDTVLHAIMGRAVEVCEFSTSPLLTTTLYKGFRFHA